MKKTILCLLGVIAITIVVLPSPVNANAPARRYVVSAGSGSGNGTVYDSKTKLTWQQTSPSTKYALADAKQYCAQVGTSLSGTGWRLPTIKELLTIVDYSLSSPAIDPNAFPLTPATVWFWSSSPVVAPGSTSKALGVYFGRGNDFFDDPSVPYNVRCVR